MPLFKIGQKLEHIKETSFKLEREIQQLTEQNLQTLLHLDFIKSEFSYHLNDTTPIDNFAPRKQ